MADAVTLQELKLIAHYGFEARFDTVVKNTLAYARLQREHTQACAKLADTEELMEAVAEHADELPAKLNLRATVESQLGQATRDAESARTRLGKATEMFFEAAGPAASQLVGILEECGYDINQPKLTEALTGRLPV